MSEHPFTDEEGGEESEDGDDSGLENERTKIDVRVGNLQIAVENHDREACEEQFYRVYEFLMSDVEEWSRAMDNVLTRDGGFR
ncbi:hypothetical protein ACAH01_11710 [Halomicrobium sp. HM KBTZ05]|uniref:hypothetical protein n=1 Tax=Halomicrobium sp. HM KBTZ05 TaxID=3242663 RepID=UPI003557C580